MAVERHRATRVERLDAEGLDATLAWLAQAFCEASLSEALRRRKNGLSLVLAVADLVENWHGQKELTLPGVRVVRTGSQITLKSTKTLKSGAC